MGQDKALLSYRRSQGEVVPLLNQICRVAALGCGFSLNSPGPTTPPRIWVLTPRSHQYAPLLPLGCACLPETQPDDLAPGPLVAFAQALALLQQLSMEGRNAWNWVLLLACDLPALTPATIQAWLPLLERASPEAIALLPRGPKGWEPLCGFYRPSVQRSLVSAIQQGERSFQRWLQGQVVEPLPVKDPTELHNCNSPQDWEKFVGKVSE